MQLIIDEHLESVDELDSVKLLKSIADDIIEMPPNAKRITGIQDYQMYFSTWKEFIKTLKHKEMNFSPDEFVVSDNWAFQIGTYTTEFTLPNDSVLKDEGNYLWIFKKQAGQWKWARVISNATP
ncbi:nuclear transport factor 2 family protein [Labilibacter sediminis]|nr:nuclear transport factor 2 family protein [Labilibacter sediminis]